MHRTKHASLTVVLGAIVFGTVGSIATQADDLQLSLQNWTYIQVDAAREQWGKWDEPKWLNYFGLDMADVTGDGYLDIVAGRYVYHNPGGNMSGPWARIDLGMNIDGMLFVDVDGDDYGDIIGMALPQVYWLEAQDQEGRSWRARQIGTLKKTGHVNGQGYMLAQIVPGGREEILLACEDGVYALMIPDDPTQGDWPKRRLAHEVMDEGIGVGDLDDDGDIDVVCGRKHDDAFTVTWFVNPGDDTADWPARPIGPSDHAPDRIVLADINGDQRLDVAVSEERWPGKEPDANLYWFEQGSNNAFRRHLVITEYSLNNLDVADMDGDGDMDLVTCEHKGPKGQQKLQIFANNGAGQFTEHIIDRGKESHLGARVADMDGDGDYDIVSAAWDYPEFLHLWRNNAVSSRSAHPSEIRWQHLSTRTGQIAFADVGNQAASLVFDINQDGIDDIVIAGWSDATSVVWLNNGTACISRPWKDKNHQYRVLLQVGAAGYRRRRAAVEIELDFSQLLRQCKTNDSIDPARIRLYEQQKNGLTPLPFQFERNEDWHARTDAKGTLIFMLDGSTAPQEVRRFELYFGHGTGDLKSAPDSRLVSVQSGTEHEAQESFCITAQNSTYYYHKLGAGFASLEDRDGHDWLSYNPGVGAKSQSGSGGKYRGLPNMGHPEGYCHPGNKASDTRLLASGPHRVTLESKSNDGKMHCRWDIFPSYARLTVLKMRSPYWFLYEGTPGGKLDMQTDQCMRMHGRTAIVTSAAEKWQGDLKARDGLEWLAFVDPQRDRSLYLVHHEDDEAVESYWPMNEEMTVFGFGRLGINKYMRGSPAHFTIGLVNTTDTQQLRKAVNSACQPLFVAVGPIEMQ